VIQNKAKALGVTLQTCKKKIEHLKKIVEQIGREREMENLNKCPVNNSFGQEESEAISKIGECQNSIESEMVTYKEGFNKLRHLKATIEHMQLLLEKSKLDMQSDFDVWYSETSKEPRETSDIGTYSNAQKGKRDSKTASTVLPEGVRLTGDKETDGNIIAFYRAKESFLAKQK
jgi:hypothetical protein